MRFLYLNIFYGWNVAPTFVIMISAALSGNANNIQDCIERGLLDIDLIPEPVDMRKYNFVNMSIKEQ